MEAARPLVLGGVSLVGNLAPGNMAATVADVSLAGQRIAAIGPAGTLPGERLPLDGYLLVPSLVEPHAHLDKAYTADAICNPDGSLLGAITAWMPARAGFRQGDIAARAWAVTHRYLVHGTTAIRAHVDTGEGIGLRALEAVLAVRHAVGDLMDIEVVAGCSRPVTGVAGASNRAMLKDALAAGADLVGGAPAIDDNPAAAVDALVDMAAEAGVGMDLHTDETTDPAVVTIDRLISAAKAGFAAPITASHVVSLGAQPRDRQVAIAATLAETGIGVVTLPQTNLYLQGRGEGSHARRGLTAVRTLLDAGVSVAAGGDNLQDPFNPMGRADPLETASLLVIAAHLLPADAFELVTSAGRRALRRTPVSVAEGMPADLLAIRAPTVRAAMAAGTADRVVIRAGRVVARTTVDCRSALADEPDWGAP